MVKTRCYFSDIFLMAGAKAARDAHALERSSDGGLSEPLIFDHHGAVLTAILMSAAALEAAINELFSDSAEPDGGRFDALSADSRALLADMWKSGVPRTASFRILQKYEICLALLRRPALVRGAAPYQNADGLVKLRNHFLHFEPAWQPKGQSASHKEADHLEKLLDFLRSRRFPESPLAGSGNSFYPEKLLGHGCAAWAVASARAFLNEFFERLQIPVPHDVYSRFLETVST